MTQVRASGEPALAQVRMEHVTKIYQRGGEAVHALVAVDLTIAPGAFVAVMGKSGSGKTTLLNVLTGIDRPTSGEIWLGDRRIDTLSEEQLAILRRQRIGLIFQAFNLLNNMSVLENVLLPALLVGRGRGPAARWRSARRAGAGQPAHQAAGAAFRRGASARRHRPRAGERSRRALRG
jgi:putative ABC transport system ATP-binding protein